jgi:hypothetical protein
MGRLHSGSILAGRSLGGMLLTDSSILAVAGTEQYALLEKFGGNAGYFLQPSATDDTHAIVESYFP